MAPTALPHHHHLTSTNPKEITTLTQIAHQGIRDKTSLYRILHSDSDSDSSIQNLDVCSAPVSMAEVLSPLISPSLSGSFSLFYDGDVVFGSWCYHRRCRNHDHKPPTSPIRTPIPTTSTSTPQYPRTAHATHSHTLTFLTTPAPAMVSTTLAPLPHRHHPRNISILDPPRFRYPCAGAYDGIQDTNATAIANAAGKGNGKGARV